jgi:hypothetical protein
MAIAAPARRSAPQTAPPPARTEPPQPKKRPRDRPRPGAGGRSSAASPATAPARKPASPKRRKAAAGAKKTIAARASAATARAATAAPARKPARKAAPSRRKAAPKRRTAGVIPIAAGTAGRAAVAVTQLPESGLIHRLTRGRAWIGVLGVLLVGIVALNVVTLSFAASAGKVDERITLLSKENSMLQGRAAQHYGQARVRHEAAKLGYAASTAKSPQLIIAHKGDVTKAASRLGAAAPPRE